MPGNPSPYNASNILHTPNASQEPPPCPTPLKEEEISIPILFLALSYPKRILERGKHLQHHPPKNTISVSILCKHVGNEGIPKTTRFQIFPPSRRPFQPHNRCARSAMPVTLGTGTGCTFGTESTKLATHHPMPKVLFLHANYFHALVGSAFGGNLHIRSPIGFHVSSDRLRATFTFCRILFP